LKRLGFVEAVCLVAGAGIGGGVMAVPYLAERTGFLPACGIAVLAYAVTLILHIMVAELSVRTDYSGELLTVFSRHLFKGKKLLSAMFYILMAVTLVCNLAAYVVGSGEILSQLTAMPVYAGKLIFFAIAAFVVFLGLKRIAVNEVFAILILLCFLGAMSVLSFRGEGQLRLFSESSSASPLLAVYGMIMFSFSSLFAVPQAASGLKGSRKRLILAVCLGLLINLAVTLIVIAASMYASQPVTEVAIVGWAAALGPVVNILGSLFIFIAMLSTFWSISLQLCDMTGSFFKAGHRLSWLIATLPCFALAMLPVSGFLDLMQLAGGATAVIIALMVVPAYRNSIKGEGAEALLLGGLGKSKGIALAIVIMYILMAVASFL
jgi:amino acid permease